VSQKAPTTVKISTAALNAAVDKAHDVLISTDGGPAAKLVDSIVREPMLKGEPILEAKVVRAGASGVLAVELTPGMRAMSVPLSAESAAGGFVLPGDHVDLVQSRQVDSAVPGQKRFVTMTILKNVKVLAIDQNTSRNQKSAALVGATATLEISPAEAELVSQAKAQGEVSLVLRSYADIGGPTVAGARKDEVKVASPMVRVFRSSKPDEIAVTR
jgi:pilus assembly protein CpaB